MAKLKWSGGTDSALNKPWFTAHPPEGWTYYIDPQSRAASSGGYTVRRSDDKGVLNARGVQHGLWAELTGRALRVRSPAEAKRLAQADYDHLTSSTHENPDLLVLSNPPRGTLVGKRVHRIEYKHASDSKNYFHDFGSDVRMEALPDGSVRIYSTTGRRIWGDYP